MTKTIILTLVAVGVIAFLYVIVFISYAIYMKLIEDIADEDEKGEPKELTIEITFPPICKRCGLITTDAPDRDSWISELQQKENERPPTPYLNPHTSNPIPHTPL